MPLANQGAVINQSSSSLNSIKPTGILASSSSNILGQNSAPIQQGTTPGLISNNANSNTHTVTTNTSGGTTTKPTPNPSVLAQQQALNKLGAGLVEDGISGPKTAAAIAQYGNQSGSISSNTNSIKAPDDSSNKFNTATGQPNPNYKDSNAPVVSQQTQNGMVNSSTGVNANGSTSSTAYTPPNQGTDGISQGGLIGNAVGQSQTPNPIATTAANNLNALGLGGNNSPEVQAAIKDLQDLQAKYAGNTKNIASTAGFLTQQGGEQALQNSQYSTLLGAAQSRLQNALTQQGQQISASSAAGGLGNQSQGLQQSALGTAIGANAPVSQFGLLTNPTTGQIVGGNGSNAQQLMNTSLQKAVQLYNSGAANFNDALSISGLSQFGNLGNSLLSSALGNNSGGFNPTSQATSVATNQSNLANTIGQGFSVNQGLQQIDAIQPVIEDFLKSSGVNPFDAQIYNGPVSDYLSSIGKSAVIPQWEAQMGDLRNFTSQLLSSGYGGTPTGVQESTLKQDPSNLSYAGMQAYLQTLKDLGGNRLNVLQNTQNALGGTGYTGAPATKVTSTKPVKAASGEVGTGITSPVAQYGAGLTLGAAGTAQKIGSEVVQGGALATGAKILGKILPWLIPSL